MDLGDAADYAAVLTAQDRVASDPSRSWLQKVRDYIPTTGLRPASQRSSGTFGDILRVAIGGALGYGVARGAASVLGLSDSSTNALSLAGASAGGLMGLTKSGSDERIAFRVAFIKSAIDKGYFTKKAFIAPLILAPISGLTGTMNRIGESAGSVVGSADAPDDVDKDIVQTQVESELLRQEEARVEAQRQNQILKQVLAKRRLKRK
jgi:hypothetical protein